MKRESFCFANLTIKNMNKKSFLPATIYFEIYGLRIKILIFFWGGGGIKLHMYLYVL